jgi:hypothetical protein
MGSTFGSVLTTEDEDESGDDVTFVVNSDNLTHNQRIILAEHSLLQGVPFTLSNEGINRKKSQRVQLRMLQSEFSIRAPSVSVKCLAENQRRDQLIISFIYDSEIPLQLIILMRGRKPERGLTFGSVAQKVSLPQGSGIDFSSKPLDDFTSQQDDSSVGDFVLLLQRSKQNKSTMSSRDDESKDCAFTKQLSQFQVTTSTTSQGDEARVQYTARLLHQELVSNSNESYKIASLFGDDGNVKYEDANTSECVVCLTEPRAIAVLPCGHLCLCETCTNSLITQGSKCPLCRKRVQLFLRVASKKEGERNEGADALLGDDGEDQAGDESEDDEAQVDFR